MTNMGLRLDSAYKGGKAIKKNDAKAFFLEMDEKKELRSQVDAQGRVNLFLEGAIDNDAYFGLTPDMFRDALADANGKDVIVRINSPGGSAFASSAIAADLKAYQGNVTAVGTGLVGSGATFIAVNADMFLMAKGGVAQVAFHEAHGTMLIGGTADDIEKSAKSMAESLRAINDSWARVFAEKSGKDKEETMAWLVEERNFNAEQAIEANISDGYMEDDESLALEEMNPMTLVFSDVKAEKKLSDKELEDMDNENSFRLINVA